MLGVREPAILKVNVSEELVRQKELAVGDRVAVELATITGRIEKG